jgi:hypothetical protein
MPEGACNLGGELTLNVSDNQVAGAIEDPTGTFPIQGLLNAGVGSLRMGTSLGLARFADGKFTLAYRDSCGLRHIDGAFVPKPPPPDYAGKKKTAETSYAELVARAMRGDLTVDFKAMRFAYPFTSAFDPAITTQDGARLRQSFDAGDCSDTVIRSDGALKLDFTNPKVHAMRAACFEKAGDMQRAELEHAIERGLIDSLRKGADGRTRDTAYVVHSYREEVFAMEDAGLNGAAVLSLWGPNYHRYDLVRTFNRASGERRIVWFDSQLMIEGMAQFVPSPP